ncbi:glycosyltransferase family 31 protein [Metarhizium robertsii ARSEF 23]|uniref:Glycosyltransferase family 31 protein n=1 Tax=Metarhizium robertsii (strain ARSEF 23 / ATCC MYA-3075) TaxID=655844 RepID=E9EMR1_METRA|nr:glycosyltransferase family 31 protein [Metarhizium robertsii ARSEF 23]EFZ04532.1 glycosyltransferase family 31 protein [Metarhizium robertsii ARSEF 23]
MIPFNQSYTSRLSPLTNKRLNRNILLRAALFLLTGVFLWSRRKPAAVPGIPTNELWLESDEFNKTYNFPTTSDSQPVSQSPGSKTTQQLCASFPKHKLSRIQPVLKLGYSEDRDKIESQLDNLSACFSTDDLLIFSNMEETLRGHKVIDILAYLPDTYRKGSDTSKFQQYLLQKEMKENRT